MEALNPSVTFPRNKTKTVLKTVVIREYCSLVGFIVNVNYKTFKKKL